MPDHAFLDELARQSGLDAALIETLRDVHLRVCRALQVSDGTDARTATVARAVIAAAYEGARDPEEIFRRAMAAVRGAG